MNFRDSSKIWCLNFKPQYLLNYSSPTNNFKAFERIQSHLSFWFSNCWLRRTGSRLSAKPLHAWCLWLHFSLFQNMLGPLWPNLVPSGIKWLHKKSGKMELRSFFLFFGPVFLILETSSQQSVKMRAMLCNFVWIFFTIRSAGAFRRLRILSGANTHQSAN